MGGSFRPPYFFFEAEGVRLALRVCVGLLLGVPVLVAVFVGVFDRVGVRDGVVVLVPDLLGVALRVGVRGGVPAPLGVIVGVAVDDGEPVAVAAAVPVALVGADPDGEAVAAADDVKLAVGEGEGVPVDSGVLVLSGVAAAEPLAVGLFVAWALLEAVFVATAVRVWEGATVPLGDALGDALALLVELTEAVGLRDAVELSVATGEPVAVGVELLEPDPLIDAVLLRVCDGARVPVRDAVFVSVLIDDSEADREADAEMEPATRVAGSATKRKQSIETQCESARVHCGIQSQAQCNRHDSR